MTTDLHVTTDEAVEALKTVTDALDAAARRIRKLGETEHPDIQAALATGRFTLDKAAGLLRWDDDGNPVQEEAIS